MPGNNVTQLLASITEWMREPDYAEDFSLADMVDWINRRPLAPMGQVSAALADHVVVPREPTEAMIYAGRDRIVGAQIVSGWPGVHEIYRAMIAAAPGVADHVVGWRTMDSAPKDGTWILIGDDHCWPPDLVRWQPERPRRTINGNSHLAIPAGWFGSPGGRSRFDMPDGHLMKATRWHLLPAAPSPVKEG